MSLCSSQVGISQESGAQGSMSNWRSWSPVASVLLVSDWAVDTHWDLKGRPSGGSHEDKSMYQ